MSRSCFRSAAARAALIAVAVGPCSALAGDKPTTPEGAEGLKALFSKFLPAAPDGPAFVTVRPDGKEYLVSADLSALGAILKGAAVSSDPATLVYKLIEQDDGKWRVDQDSFPKLVSRANDVSSSVEITNYRQTFLIDPALAWWLSGTVRADKGLVTLRAPKVDETFDFGAVKGDYATTVNADGTVSSVVKDEFDDLGMKISAVGKDNATVNTSVRLDKFAVNLGADRLKSRKAFDIWTLVAERRDDLARHEAELKALLRDVAAPGLKIVEGAEATKAMIASPYGAIALAAFKAAIGVTNQGPQSAINATWWPKA